jgi:hypothetical protein
MPYGTEIAPVAELHGITTQKTLLFILNIALEIRLTIQNLVMTMKPPSEHKVI